MLTSGPGRFIVGAVGGRVGTNPCGLRLSYSGLGRMVIFLEIRFEDLRNRALIGDPKFS
jgi:hypothetical protein